MKGYQTLLAALSCALGVSQAFASAESEVGLELEPDNCRVLVMRQWVDRPANVGCFGVNLGLVLSSRMSARVHTGLQLTGYGIRYRYDEAAFSELLIHPLRWGRGKEYFIFISHNLKF
jgi:hypothetical protein